MSSARPLTINCNSKTPPSTVTDPGNCPNFSIISMMSGHFCSKIFLIQLYCTTENDRQVVILLKITSKRMHHKRDVLYRMPVDYTDRIPPDIYAYYSLVVFVFARHGSKVYRPATSFKSKTTGAGS